MLPESPKFSPRNSLLSALGFGDATATAGNSAGSALMKRLSHSHPSSSPAAAAGSGDTRHGSGVTGGGRGGELMAPPPPTREKCPQCGAVFGDVSTLVNHVERFHSKVLVCSQSPGRTDDEACCC